MKNQGDIFFDYQKIFFAWQELSSDELVEITKEMSIKMLRWMAMVHPDNRTREKLLRLSKLKIGERTVINIGINVYSSEEYVVDIGERCAIAANVALITESGPNMSSLNEISFVRDKFIKKGKIVIEDDVWLGHCVVIFPGITIGKSSIIGANSVIKQDVEPFTIVKTNFTSSIRNFHQND